VVNIMLVCAKQVVVYGCHFVKFFPFDILLMMSLFMKMVSSGVLHHVVW
jgi:hypothetical protein